MRLAALVVLALGAGCLSLAGLDEDYVLGSAGSGGAVQSVTTSGPSSGGANEGGAAAGGMAGSAGGAAGYCEEPGLIACYPFEGNANDVSMNGNDATALGVDYGAGRVGDAIELDGDSRVTVDTSQSMAVSALTLEVWVNPSVLPQRDERFAIADWTTMFDAWIYPWGVRCHYDEGGMVGSPIPINAWTHVACTNDGATLRTYINGVETASEPLVLSGMAPSAPVFIGSNEPNGDDNFFGMLDEMRVFDHARTQPAICAAAGENCP